MAKKLSESCLEVAQAWFRLGNEKAMYMELFRWQMQLDVEREEAEYKLRNFRKNKEQELCGLPVPEVIVLQK